MLRPACRWKGVHRPAIVAARRDGQQYRRVGMDLLERQRDNSVHVGQDSGVQQQGKGDTEEPRSSAITALLCAGQEPPPPRWLQVELLAAARRAAAADPIGFPVWLQTQQRLGGLPENAALIAALRTPSRADAVAAYLPRYPDRERLVLELLQWA